MQIAVNKPAQLDNWHFLACVFIDFKKAFDTVDRKLLSQKLENYDFR